MTDRETLIVMFERAGIKFNTSGELKTLTLKSMSNRHAAKQLDENWKTGDQDDLIIEAGYIGFTSHFAFNDDGSLKSVEAYE